MKQYTKLAILSLCLLLFGFLTQPAFAGDCTISTVIRCYFDIDEIYFIADDTSITVYQPRINQQPLVLNTISYEEIVELLTELSEAGSRLVRRGQLESDATLFEFAQVAKKLGLYRNLTSRILNNGHLLLSDSADNKANIYLLAQPFNDAPVFQVNIGPDINGRVQVVTLTLFSNPSFYETLEFNIFNIDFSIVPALPENP